MKKLKRLWLCRNVRGGNCAWYAIYVDKKPSRELIDEWGEWKDPGAFACPRSFHATHSIRLAPGDGPVEVEPLRIKKARKP